MQTLTLESARKINKQRERKSVIKFAAAVLITAGLTAAVYMLSDYFKTYPMLWVLPALAVVLAVKRSKIYLFLKPREYSGRITDCYLYVERNKTNLSHQAGVSLSASEDPKMDITVVDDTGKKHEKTFYCNSVLTSLKADDFVAALRFIDQPIILEIVDKI